MSLIKDGESSFEGREEGLAEGRIGSRFIAVKEREWGLLGGAMRGRVVVELSGRKELGP